jgi:hypothetical protein
MSHRTLGVLAVITMVVVGFSAQGRGGQGAQGGRGGRGGSAAERAAALEAAQAADPKNFTGYWGMPGYKTPAGHGFEAREACAGLKDPSGQPMERCDQPWEAKGGAKFGIKDFLNKRGLAWMQYRDEMISEKHLCLPTVMPGIMDHEAGQVRWNGPNELKIQFSTDAFAEGVERTIYMDGRKHPEPREIYLQGHSVGHYEGNELVIESTNFPFSPDGIDDHLHIPSSAAKKITERWKKTSPTTLDVTFTIEDQVFLEKPWTFTWHYVKEKQLPLTDYTCDAEAAWLQIQVATPSPYNK